jgi:hypothetical protein
MRWCSEGCDARLKTESFTIYENCLRRAWVCVEELLMVLPIIHPHPYPEALNVSQLLVNHNIVKPPLKPPLQPPLALRS